MHGLIFILALLLSFVIARVPLRFDDARDFYHNLGKHPAKFLLHKIALNIETVEMLNRLLADDEFDIKASYNSGCSSMSKARISMLLTVVHGRKDLEMHLLGPGCLSKRIIKARKKRKMWPLAGFPLLIRDFEPDCIHTEDTRDILERALGSPEGWQSVSWIDKVRWKNMNDLRFWRMVPVDGYERKLSFRSYIMRALLQFAEQPTGQDLEELLMKSIRVGNFGHRWKKALKERHLDSHAILCRFSHLQDPWSIKALALLKEIYSRNWNKKHRRRILLKSGLLNSASWEGSLIEVATATNDILELFAVGFSSYRYDDGELVRLFRAFLDSIVDWSIVRPVALLEAIGEDPTDDRISIGSYVDKMLTNPNILPVLPYWMITQSTSRQIQKNYIKMCIGPLVDEFLFIDRGSYIELLYQELEQDKNNWPGMMIAHELVSKRVRGVFKSSESENGTWDPRTDRAFVEETWRLAFESIIFDVNHNIPSSAVPSLCFLRILFYYTRGGLDGSWVELKKEAGENCKFPEGEEERAHYQRILDCAFRTLFDASGWFYIASAEFFQALIRGNDSDDMQLDG